MTQLAELWKIETLDNWKLHWNWVGNGKLDKWRDWQWKERKQAEDWRGLIFSRRFLIGINVTKIRTLFHSYLRIDNEPLDDQAEYFVSMNKTNFAE